MIIKIALCKFRFAYAISQSRKRCRRHFGSKGHPRLRPLIRREENGFTIDEGEDARTVRYSLLSSFFFNVCYNFIDNEFDENEFLSVNKAEKVILANCILKIPDTNNHCNK